MFGTGILALRLPSALFGVASIPLVYALGTREDGKATGLVAAGMLALNGHQVYWSEFRGYVPACFLGLVTTVLLLKLTREVSRPARLHLPLLPVYSPGPGHGNLFLAHLPDPDAMGCREEA